MRKVDICAICLDALAAHEEQNRTSKCVERNVHHAQKTVDDRISSGIPENDASQVLIEENVAEDDMIEVRITIVNAIDTQTISQSSS